MTRASLLLDHLENKRMFEACLHEAMSIPQTRKVLGDITARAKPVNSKYKTELVREGKSYKAQLDEVTADEPTLKKAIASDLDRFQDKVQQASKKVTGKLSKLKKPNKGRVRMTEASLMEEVNAVFDEFNVEEATVATLSALRGMETQKDTGWINRILYAILAYAATMLLASVHTTILVALSAVIGPYALPVCAVLVAPITEEWFKKLSILATGGSTTPSFVFTITEFFMYVSHAMVAAQMITNPVAGISGGAYLAVAILGRVFAMEMHMTTTKWYSDDYKKYGHVRDDTLRKGIGFHRLWNFSAVVLSVLAAIIAPALGLSVMVGAPLLTIGGIVGVASLAQKWMKDEKERVNHAVKGRAVPAYA